MKLSPQQKRQWKKRKRVSQLLVGNRADRDPMDGSLVGDNFVRKADQERRARVQHLIRTAIEADGFDPQPVAALASRDLFAESIKALTKLVGWRNQPGAPPLTAALWSVADGDSTLALRLSCGLGLLPPPSCLGHVRIDRAWLRSRGTEAANTALALAGEVSWPDASPRTRAGYLLGRVVAFRRGQA